MKLADGDILHRLGAGEAIDSVCAAAGMTRGEFDAWWDGKLAAKLPEVTGDRQVDGVARRGRGLRAGGQPHGGTALGRP